MERAPAACDRAPSERSVMMHLWWQCSKAIYITQGRLWIVFPPAGSSHRRHFVTFSCLLGHHGGHAAETERSPIGLFALTQNLTGQSDYGTVIVAIKVLRHIVSAPWSLFLSSFLRRSRCAANFSVFLFFYATINRWQTDSKDCGDRFASAHRKRDLSVYSFSTEVMPYLMPRKQWHAKLPQTQTAITRQTGIKYSRCILDLINTEDETRCSI